MRWRTLDNATKKGKRISINQSMDRYGYIMADEEEDKGRGDRNRIP